MNHCLKDISNYFDHIWQTFLGTKFGLLLIVILAILLRLAWIIFIPRDIAFDGLAYHALGSNMAAGLGYSQDGLAQAFWPPGYSLFLADVYLIFGESVIAVKLIQTFLGGLSCLLIDNIGRWLYHAKTGRYAALLLALYPTHISFVNLVYTEVLFTFLMLLTIFMLIQKQGHTLTSLLFAGLSLGYATLIRPEAMFLSIALGAAFFIYRRNLKQSLRLSGVLLLITFCVIIPWTIRNLVVMDRFILISDNGGFNFWVGNSPAATGGIVYDPWPYETAQGYGLGYQIGARQIMENPLWFIQLGLKKLSHFWGFERVGILVNFHTAHIKHRTIIKFILIGLANIFYLLALVGALLYLTLAQKHLPATGLISIIFLYFSLIRIAFFGDPRYHYVLIPLLLLLATEGWRLLSQQGVQLLIREQRKTVVFTCSLVILSLSLAYNGWVEWARFLERI